VTPAKYSLITPFQQPNTLQCPACGYTSVDGPHVTFVPNATSINGVDVDALKLNCTRCNYGEKLEWLLATAT
jgi:hypothetical protein